MPNSAPKIQLPTGCNTRELPDPTAHCYQITEYTQNQRRRNEESSGLGKQVMKAHTDKEKQRPEKHQRSVSKIPSGDTRMMMMIYHLLWYRGEVSLVQVSVIYEDE